MSSFASCSLISVMIWGGPSARELPSESPAHTSPCAAKRQPFLAAPWGQLANSDCLHLAFIFSGTLPFYPCFSFPLQCVEPSSLLCEMAFVYILLFFFFPVLFILAFLYFSCLWWWFFYKKYISQALGFRFFLSLSLCLFLLILFIS